MDSSTPAARIGAEFLGTFWLVFAGCGAAILAGVVLNPDKVSVGIGYLGVALAFGLTVLTMAFAVGHVSGGHFNPAVTIGLAVAKRIEWRWVPTYIATQIVAASAAGAVLWVIANGKPGFSSVATGFASNGYGDRSPGGYSLLSCAIAEVVLTAFFLYIILGATDDRAPKGFAPIAIGLSLTLIHLVGIPITNTSVNPARSLGVAWFAGVKALAQVWLFIVAPIAGGALAGASYSAITGAHRLPVDEGIANNPDWRAAERLQAADDGGLLEDREGLLEE